MNSLSVKEKFRSNCYTARFLVYSILVLFTVSTPVLGGESQANVTSKPYEKSDQLIQVAKVKLSPEEKKLKDLNNKKINIEKQIKKISKGLEKTNKMLAQPGNETSAKLLNDKKKHEVKLAKNEDQLKRVNKEIEKLTVNASPAANQKPVPAKLFQKPKRRASFYKNMGSFVFYGRRNRDVYDANRDGYEPIPSPGGTMETID
jgi:septal ring factor EnvC (AmiA/AmiB activator)